MRIVELEMPLVIKFEQSWAVGVLLLQVDVVNFWLLGRVAAVFTHVNLRSSLLVIVTVVDSMYF